MPDVGVIGNGSKIGYSASSPVSWTRLGQVMEITATSLNRNKVNKTVHSAIAYNRSMPGMIDVSDLTVKVLYDSNNKAAVDALREYWEDGTTLYWREEYPLNRTQTSFEATQWQGYILNIQREAPIGDAHAVSITIAFDDSGYAVHAAGASALG